MSELKEYYYYDDMVITPATHMYRVYHADKVDAAIAELKAKIAEKDNEIDSLKKKCEAEKSIGATFSKNGAELARWVEELRKEIESLKASHYAEMVDAGMRERRLRRALWIARANRADGEFIYLCARLAMESGFTKSDIRGYSVNTKRKLRTIGEWIEVWKNVKSKCLKKAEEYK